MKRLLTIMLLLFYLFFNAGLVINSHYCAGQLDSISFFNSLDGCKKCNVPQGCCKDTQTQLSIGEDHIASFFDRQLTHHAVVPALTLQPTFSFVPVLSSGNIYAAVFHPYETGPPKTPIYIQFRSLLI